MINVKDELSRIPGVGSVTVFGAEEYSMRIWLDPERSRPDNLTTEDVVRAIQEQNVQVAAGRIGEPPVPDEDWPFNWWSTPRAADGSRRVRGFDR